MSWIIFIAILVVALAAVGGAIAWEHSGKKFVVPGGYNAATGQWRDVVHNPRVNGLTNIIVPVSAAIAIIAVVCLVVMGLREWSYSYDRAECKAWAGELGLDVRYEMTGYWDGNCLVPLDGQWVNRTQWEDSWKAAQLKP